MKGRVVNLNSNDGIAKSQVRLIDKEGNVLKETYTSENGDFRIEIPWQEEVTVQATKARHSVFTASYTEKELENVQQSNLNLGLSFIDDLLTEKEGKPVIKLQNFYFDTGKVNITPTIQTELDKVVDAVQRFPQLKLIIETHTNSKGSKASNQKLSQNRSDAIKQYLLQNGVISTNIVASIGYGEEKLTNNCADGVYCLDFLHRQNDRTLIVISNSEEL